MSFAMPIVAWIAAAGAVVLTVAFALDFTRRRRVLERVGHPPMLQRMAGSLSNRRRVVKVVLLIVAVTLTGLALARPQVEGESTWRQRGIDLAVVMDFSKSMLAGDVYPSRYERMVYAADDLIDGLEADRIATIAFAGASVHFPLTHDHEAAKILYRGLEPPDLAPGSDLGEAFRSARCILRPDVESGGCERTAGRGRGGGRWGVCRGGRAPVQPEAQAPSVAERARAIVIFTDGEDTEGEVRAQVEQALALGIEIYLVGVGTSSGELIPEYDEQGNEIGWKKDDSGEFVTTRLDRAALLELAALAGGEDHYFDLGSGSYGMEDLVQELKKLKRGDLDELVIHKPTEIYQWFLFPAFLLLVIEACMGDRRRRRKTPAEEKR